MEAATRGHGIREQWRENQEKYTTALTIPGGNIRRQIDYIMITAKYRNMTSKAQSNIMAFKYGPESATPSTDDAALLQCRREIH